MGAGYGLASPGIFRMPYALQRQMYGGTGGNQDPLAALIGGALGTYEGQTEKAKQDALAAKHEQDEADWRNFTGRLTAYKEGLTTEAPAPTSTSPELSPGAYTGPTGLRAPDLSAATTTTPAKPALMGPGGTPFYRDVGRQMLTKYQPVAEGTGAFDPSKGTTTPTGFTPPVKPVKPEHIDPLSPLGIQRTVERGQQEIAAGVKITPTQRRSAGDGMAAQSADLDLRQLENTNKPAIAEVARWVATPAIGHLIPGSPGTAFTDILRQTRSAGLSDPANAYLKRMFDFASLAGPARYGRRFGSDIALQQIWNDFGAGQLGIGAGGIGATQKNRQNAVRAIRTAAGEPAWREAQQVPTGGASSGGPANTRTSYRLDNPFAQP